jgi:malate synthase
MRWNSSPCFTSASTTAGARCWPRGVTGRRSSTPASFRTFPEATPAGCDAKWRVGEIPPDLQDRRVEITGPTNAKMVINALNSGAKVFMADFEDATAPAWDELLQGQVNLRARWQGTLGFTDPASGKSYSIGDTPAVLMVRPRGWHLDERHLTVDGQPIAGGLFDFGLYFWHNARAAIAAGSGPYFYVPKLESRFEAELWGATSFPSRRPRSIFHVERSRPPF